MNDLVYALEPPIYPQARMEAGMKLAYGLRSKPTYDVHTVCRYRHNIGAFGDISW